MEISHPIRLTGGDSLGAALRTAAREAIAGRRYDVARVALTTAVLVDPGIGTRYELARLLAEMGEFDTAGQQLELAWEQSRRESRPEWSASCCHALADLHRAAGRIDAANRSRQRAIRFQLEAGLDVDVAAWILDRAEEAHSAGRVEEALELAETAGRQQPDDPAIALRQMFLSGAADVRAGRSRAAAKRFVQAFHQARRTGDLRGCALAMLNLGSLLQAGGAWTRARACFELALRLAKPLNDAALVRCGAGSAAHCRRVLALLHGNPACN